MELGDARLPERFWKKVALDSGTGCWLWTGASSEGYGLIRRTRQRVMVGSHRLSYEALVGPIPDGLQIDHLCRTPACVNPLHLEPVTLSENVRRGSTPAVNRARAEAISRCPAGHPYDEANTYLRPDKPGRECRACWPIRSRRCKRKAQG